MGRGFSAPEYYHEVGPSGYKFFCSRSSYGKASHSSMEFTLSFDILFSPLSLLYIAVMVATFAIAMFCIPTHHIKPPGPWGLPVFGNLLQLGRKPHVTLTQWRSQYGDVYSITMGSRPAVVLNGLRVVRQACVRQAKEFAGRPDFYSFKFIGKGISMGFADYGPRWRVHRKIAQNALSTFTNKTTNPIEATIASEAQVLVENFLATLGRPINPHNEIYLSVGKIICIICFGKQYRRDDPEFMQLVKLNDEFMEFAGAGNTVDLMPWTRPFKRRSFNSFLGIVRLMNKFCDEKVSEHLESYDPTVLRDITDVLIRTTRETRQEDKDAVGLSDHHILNTVQELVAAGFDTISSTLQWSVLYLMVHQDLQDRVHEEIKSVIGTSRAPTFDDMEKLPVTEATLLEVMRCSCIFPLSLPHSTTQDTRLEGYDIPAKTLVLVNLWSISRDPSVFPNPDTFHPGRFLDSAGRLDRQKADCFLPFSAGRRRCPGEQLARLELFIFFTILLQRCRFTIPPGHKPLIDSKFGLTLKPLDFQVCVAERQ